MKQKRYSAAQQSLGQLLKEYPASIYRPFAHYWLAEVFLATNPPNVTQAKVHFNQVLNQYPKHSKVAPSLYKMARIYAQESQIGKAREVLEQITKAYPGSSEARLASQYLRQLSQ